MTIWDQWPESLKSDIDFWHCIGFIPFNVTVTTYWFQQHFGYGGFSRVYMAHTFHLQTLLVSLLLFSS